MERRRCVHKAMLTSIIFLVLAIACRTIGELQQHGKLRWMEPDLSKGRTVFSFWGKLSHTRKYKNHDSEQGPAFFLSTTLLVSLTDGYHHMQFWMFNFLSLSLSFAIGWDWWLFISLMVGIRLLHAGVYKIASK